MIVSEGESESDEEIIDQDFEEGLPICVQGTLTKLRRANKELRRRERLLQKQVTRSKAWAEELRQQVEDLGTQVERERRSSGDSEGASKSRRNSISEGGRKGRRGSDAYKCKKCSELRLQVEELGERLSGEGGLAGGREIAISQTVEDDFAQAAWVWHYGWPEDGGEPWRKKRRGSSVDGNENVADQVREAAEQALHAQGMVYEETSGLYYDYKSGYYFDSERSLYYDGNSGTYLEYDQVTNTYKHHSSIPEEERAAQVELRRRAREERKERKALKCQKTEPPPLLTTALDSISSVLDKAYSSDSEDENDQGLATLPCMRMIVKETEDPKVTLGALFIVTCKGGTIGSKGSHEVLLEDLGCSKNHAKISFQSEECKYFLRDLGSRNGTWINGKRLSASKVESDLGEIGQGTIVQIGKTKILCHVHPGRETCLQCEPGVMRPQDQEDKDQKAWEEVHGKKPKSRMSELKTLKRKYGLHKGESESAENDSKYFDRAGERRRVHGSDNPNEKTQMASVDEAIDNKNKGFKLLEKMGWKGEGLGKDQMGMAEPIKVKQRAQGAGLGSQSQHIVVDKGPFSKKQAMKADIWLKTQRRFEGAPVLGVFDAPDSEEEADPVS